MQMQVVAVHLIMPVIMLNSAHWLAPGAFVHMGTAGNFAQPRAYREHTAYGLEQLRLLEAV
jgi:hypothetical protein